MKSRIRRFIGAALVAAAVTALPGCADQPVTSASKDPRSDGRVWAEGQIQISGYLVDLFYVINNDVFLCTPIEWPRTKGAVLAAIGSADQTWSLTSMPLSNGARTVQYPIFADVRTLTGERRVLLPATLNVKVDIDAGEVLHSKDTPGFDIETTRSIKAGESFAVLFVNGKDDTPAILSVEAAHGSPFFKAFLNSDGPDGRRAAIEAWQIENHRVQ